MAKPKMTEKAQYKRDNERYYAEAASDGEMQQLPCGVLYRVIEEASGRRPTMASTVIVEYEGRLIDGKVFDSTYIRRRPAQFKVSELIKGWREALKEMPCGSKWEIVIPATLGYGAQICGIIPANSTLIFTLELLDVR